MKEYQKPEVTVVNFQAEPITEDEIIDDGEMGVGSGNFVDPRG